MQRAWEQEKKYSSKSIVKGPLEKYEDASEGQGYKKIQC